MNPSSKMEKSTKAGKYVYKYISKNFMWIFLVCFVLGVPILSNQYSTLILDPWRSVIRVALDMGHFNETRDLNTSYPAMNIAESGNITYVDLCSGRYIYIHDLPSIFDEDIVKNCSSLIKWFDMCPSMSNIGLGPPASDYEGILQNKSWYSTNQFTLEIIFHHKMKEYECLTNDSSKASAIFVPFYAGLEIGRHLWGFNNSVKDALSLNLTKWLAKQQEWKRTLGWDHFFVGGRISWDFRRQTDKEGDWGSKLMLLPEARNMTMLTIESSSNGNNEFAIPYPTYFHPSNKNEVLEWQKHVLNQKRHYLYSFVGGPRQNMKSSIRDKIISQCLNSFHKCRFIDCSSGLDNCNEPVEVMKVLKNSTFCLQPPGDSYTRRSTFDSILAGCIPVFFHQESAYKQYKWHFPENHTLYSVFIPEESIRAGNTNIEKILLGISAAEVGGMRKEVSRLIPKVIYGDPRIRLDDLEDAFDIAVKRVVDRVQKMRMETMRAHSKS